MTLTEALALFKMAPLYPDRPDVLTPYCPHCSEPVLADSDSEALVKLACPQCGIELRNTGNGDWVLVRGPRTVRPS